MNRVLLRLHDIKTSIELIGEYIAETDFMTNMKTRDAVERRLEVISEASRHIPDDIKKDFPAVPWQKVAGIGNILRHDYDDVEPVLIWEVVRVELIALEQAVDSMMDRLKGSRDG